MAELVDEMNAVDDLDDAEADQESDHHQGGQGISEDEDSDDDPNFSYLSKAKGKGNDPKSISTCFQNTGQKNNNSNKGSKNGKNIDCDDIENIKRKRDVNSFYESNSNHNHNIKSLNSIQINN